MYELIQAGEHTYYIDCPAKMGIYVTDSKDAYLIDSGNDKDAGKKALRHIENSGWSLKAVFNTHSHADHIGGNRHIQSKTGCSIYAPGLDCAFTQHTLLEPMCLYGGFPPKQLRHKFMMAQESDALPLTPAALPEGLEMIDLPGHSFSMVGFRTKDDIVFLADALSSEQTLEKYRIGYLYDPKAYLETLEKIKTMGAKLFIPTHAPATDCIAPLAQLNIDKANEVAKLILSLCEEPVTVEELLKRIFDEYSLTMTFEQNVLIGSTVRSYLAQFCDDGRVTVLFDDNIMRVKRT